MASQLLDNDFAKQATTPQSSVIFYDTEIGGFGLRVTKAGAKAWVLNYRVRGTPKKERRYTIGGFPEWPTSRARARARELRQEVDAGGDPMGKLHEQREAKTVADMVERYRKEHLPKKRPESRYEDESLIRQWVLPELGKRQIIDVKRADLRDLHAKVSGKTPTRANRLLSLLSKMFALARTEWEWRADNPVEGIERNSERARARYLKEEEIGRLIAALAEHRLHNSAGADAIELLLLTGARRSEVLTATWDQFDLDAAIWNKPASSTKQKRDHRVVLSDEASELLRRRMPGFRSGRVVELRPKEPVFPGGGETGHQVEIRRAWLSVCKAAGLEGVRLHDLRHSFASLLVSAGRSLPEIGALLGHTQVQTTARYSHLFDKPLREAVGIVGKIVRGAK